MPLCSLCGAQLDATYHPRVRQACSSDAISLNELICQLWNLVFILV